MTQADICASLGPAPALPRSSQVGSLGMKATWGLGRKGANGGIAWPSCRQLGCHRHGVNGSTHGSIFCPIYRPGLRVLCLLVRTKGTLHRPLLSGTPRLSVPFFSWWLRLVQWECRGHSIRKQSPSRVCTGLKTLLFLSLCHGL